MAKEAFMLNGPKAKPSAEAEPEAPVEDLAGEQRTAAAQAFLDAVKRGDAKGLADAFEELALALDAGEEDESAGGMDLPEEEEELPVEF